MGLKAFRAVGGSKPKHSCENCHCMRYSPCKCIKNPKKEVKDDASNFKGNS